MRGKRRGITCSTAALAESACAKLLQNGAISLKTTKAGKLDTLTSLGVYVRLKKSRFDATSVF